MDVLVRRGADRQTVGAEERQARRAKSKDVLARCQRVRLREAIERQTAARERRLAVILRLYVPYLERLDPTVVPKDAKTQLQERLQKRALAIPTYHVLEASGDPHRQTFVVECVIPELSLSARGEGSTRRAAEQQAAREALQRLELEKR